MQAARLSSPDPGERMASHRQAPAPPELTQGGIGLRTSPVPLRFSDTQLMRFVLRLLLNGVAIVVAAYFVRGLVLSGPVAALEAGVMLGLINAIIRPVLKILAFPITVLTLGLFTLVINGVCLWLTTVVVGGFEIETVTAAVVGALVVGVVSWLLSLVLAPKRDD